MTKEDVRLTPAGTQTTPRGAGSGLRIAFLAASALAAAALCNPAHASNADFGYVTDFLGMPNGGFLFFSTGARSTPPSCQGPNIDARWAINASTPAGQEQLSTLLAAIAMHKRVLIIGTGVCDIEPDSETAAFWQVENP